LSTAQLLALHQTNGCGFKISVYNDSTNLKNIDQIRLILAQHAERFVPSEKFAQIFNSKHTYWIYLQRSQANDKQEYVFTFRMWASYMEVYPEPFITCSGYSGQMVPYALKSLSGCSIPLEAGKETYLLKLQTKVHYSEASLQSIQIDSAHTFLHKKEKLNFIQGLVQGMFWLMLFYNLMLYVVVRKRVHLFYAIYIFFNSMFLLYVFGYSETYLFPFSSGLNLLLYTFQPVSLLFYVMFIRLMMFSHCPAYTLSTDRKTLYSYTFFLLLANLVIVASVFYKIDIYILTSRIINLVSCMVGLAIFIYHYKKSDSILHIIMSGSILMIAFSCLSIFYGPIDWLFDNISFEIGLLAELILFTYAINRQYSDDIEKRYKAELAQKELESKIELKNRELVYQAIQLSAKGEAILSVKEKIKNLHLSKDVNNPILNELKANDSANKNLWKEFELHFNETHPGFYKTLIEKYPQLTQSEIKLCAFLKLNLNTKDISMITQRTPHSIEAMRSRIRQKMKLDRNDSLSTELAKF
jgi:hypothetical protein